MTDTLATSYLGLELRAPVVASPSPLTGELTSLRQLEDAGVGAVVLPSLFEEEIVGRSLALDHVLDVGTESFGESLSYFPELDDYGTGPDRHLELVAGAKEQLSIPVIASLNANTRGGWVHHATLLEEAGADALELNLYTVAANPDRSAADVEDHLVELVRDVRAVAGVPLAVKLSPYFSSLANFARRIEEAGADGLVLFNRFYQPDLDLATLEVEPSLELSQPWELRLPLRWIAIMRPLLRGSLAATSGVDRAEGALKALLVGADVAMVASALLRTGPALVTGMLDGMRGWLRENEYESVEQLKGSVSYTGAENPEAFERANYLRVLDSWGRTR